MKKAIFINLLLISLMACTKDGDIDRTGIADITFRDTIDLNEERYSDLNVLGGWAYGDMGVRGTILYRSTSDIIFAFERQCTYNPTSVCSTTDVNPFAKQIEDADCCGSIFRLTNGTVFQGPAINALKQYDATLMGSIVIVSNN